MEKDQFIAADDFCAYYKVEYSFIDSLHQSGLVEITTIEEKNFLPAEQIRELEKFARLHYELEINVEGIEAIAHLLNRVKEMQQEITSLRKKL